ncbi:hypothetical protein QR680_009859 [Steinernema hermaphroditum]|uniref:Uncharacterized protein n=1 Tax=Steinernema hermaphroditum TaxID=289476 RepID=A0AA39M9M6_9BILA|nr:hypothetical protein QR680_009859 [Steinernema hermaphroditum]
MEESTFLGVPYVIIPILFVPVHVVICLILASTKKFYRQAVYLILLQLCYANGILLVTMFFAGIFELTKKKFNFSDDVRPLEITMSALSFWYRVIYASLALLLVINRIIWAFGLYLEYEVDIYRYFFFLMWFGLAVLVLMSNYLSFQFTYNLKHHYYLFNDSNSGSNVDNYIIIGLLATSTLCHLTVLLRLLYLIIRKRLQLYRSDVLMYIVVVLIFIPFLVMQTARHFLEKHVEENAAYRFTYIFSYRMVAVLNIVTVIVFNKDLQKRIEEASIKNFRKTIFFIKMKF